MKRDTKFQVTTFEAYSNQFSRVADCSIISGLDRDALKARIEHLTLEARLRLFYQLLDGYGTYRDTEGKLCRVNVVTRSE
jgi:hypothetical protein